MMSPTEVAERVTLLEQEVDRLKQRIAKLLETLEDHPQHFFRTLQLDKLTLAQGEDTLATLHIQKPGKGFSPEVELRTTPGMSIKLQTDQSVDIVGGKYLCIVADATFLECASVVVEGELAARLKYSKPFIWRKSQERVRLSHATKGFPIITRIVTVKGQSNRINTSIYIDQIDQHWYLEGSEGLEEVRAVFVGKI